jgi:hypothetical protein
MRLRSITFCVLAAGLMPSCSSDSPTDPSSPTSSSPNSPAATPTPRPSTNRPPGPVVIDYQPKGTVLAGATSVGFGAAVTDPDGDALTYTWDFGDEVITTTNAGLGYTFRRGRDTTVRLTVSDGKGGTSQGTTQVSVGTLDGTWSVTDAVHEPLSAQINHAGGPSLSGSMSNGASISGSVSDPFGVRLRLDVPSAYCLLTGTYNGSTDSSLNTITFPGGGCKGFELHR